jgi:hypothetical protein
MQLFCGKQHGRQMSPRMQLTDILLARPSCWMRSGRRACRESPRQLKMR